MNLQFFAKPEDTGGDVTPPEPEGDGDKTVTLEEMQRRLKKEEKKHEDAVAELKKSFETQLAEAIANAQAEAKLTGKELQAYKEKENERKFAELQAENERLKQEGVRRDMRESAIKTLTEKGMTVNDAVLGFVVKDTAEETLQAIDDMAELFKLQKEALANTQPPLGSGGQGSGDETTPSASSILDKAKITGF